LGGSRRSFLPLPGACQGWEAAGIAGTFQLNGLREPESIFKGSIAIFDNRIKEIEEMIKNIIEDCREREF
jgi:hypothetical protein